jgi:hypothetical protein
MIPQQLWGLVAVSLVLAVGICFAYGRYQHAAVLRDWEMVLSAEGRRAVDRVRERVQLDAMMVGHSYERAAAAFARADLAETKRLLEATTAVLSSGTHDRVTRLRGMVVCARMAAAIMPVPPVSPAELKLRQTSWLAAVGGTVHHFLVAPLERFALRAYVTLWGLRIALNVATRSTQPETMETFGAAKDDWNALDRAHLELFRALMASLAAEEKVAEEFVVDL